MVVLAITSILTALLFPGMRAARDSAHRLMCASNMRQLGTAMILYAHDNRERLPHSELAARGQRLDQMAFNASSESFPDRKELDGLGKLFLFDKYCDSPKCLYCPSHRNNHTFEANETAIQNSTEHLFSDEPMVFSNYQYVAADDEKKLHILSDDRILLSDGFRTKRDFNHRVGMNTVRGDGSIQWWNDSENKFYLALPDTPLGSSPLQTEIFDQVWDLVGESDQQQQANN
jgi:type II secretory pathway pseudopilin PulG